jgi:hypothetical protein
LSLLRRESLLDETGSRSLCRCWNVGRRLHGLRILRLRDLRNLRKRIGEIASGHGAWLLNVGGRYLQLGAKASLLRETRLCRRLPVWLLWSRSRIRLIGRNISWLRRTVERHASLGCKKRRAQDIRIHYLFRLVVIIVVTKSATTARGTAAVEYGRMQLLWPLRLPGSGLMTASCSRLFVLILFVFIVASEKGRAQMCLSTST